MRNCFGGEMTLSLAPENPLGYPTRVVPAKGGNPRHPHHILHKYEAYTATAWPARCNMVSRQRSLDRHT
jgi:hypothetical protein